MSNNECNCGCGGTPKGRYLPGHDAKHKGRLIKEARSADRRIREAAVREAVEIGWGGKVDGDALESVPQRNQEGRTTCHIDDVDMWFIDTMGGHHTHRKCQGVRGTIEPMAWTIRHPRGWAICDTCTHTHTFLEEWEATEARKAWSLVARSDKPVERKARVVVDPDYQPLPVAAPTVRQGLASLFRAVVGV